MQKSEIRNGLHIVTIGASAGGLEAINDFFDNLPTGAPLAFIIIQHLSPHHKSLLVELISKHTTLEVAEAEHNVKVTEGTVHVIPNDKVMTIQDGHLKLAEKAFDRAPNTAIDIFLTSLAKDQQQKAIAVILSGTGSDGSRGIQEIKTQGGLVFVQDPLSAQFDGMPNSAISSGFVDFILPPDLMPDEIFACLNEKPLRLPDKGQPTEASLPEVLSLVEKQCGHDFTNYKPPTLLRRISRRMAALGVKHIKEYLGLLQNSSEECGNLGKDFLIGVTRFFRDEAAFEQVKKELHPLIHQKNNGEAVKVWIAACSTGEEAYSMAILLNEMTQQQGKHLELKFFATDLDQEAIDTASKGVYSESSVQHISRKLLDKYFFREENRWIVKPHLRKQIVFAKHNIIKDPPFIKNDVISCRNMLIYMNATLQAKVFSVFHFALNPGGFLFLGPSEVPQPAYGFDSLNVKWKIYKRNNRAAGLQPNRLPAAKLGTAAPYTAKKQVFSEVEEGFHQALINQHQFAAVVIDKNLDIRDSIGKIHAYLQLPERIVSLNILKMVDQELSLTLGAAIRQCLKEKTEFSLHHVRLTENQPPVHITLKYLPASSRVLIIFGQATQPADLRMGSHDAVTPSQASYIAELEDELKETRRHLQMTVESLETANEELQSSNEELLSSNEELQSSNEELQSLNEELHTLNTEHQLRIKELIELNDDLDNYFRSTEIANVFLDKDLKIRKFNPAAARIINLMDGDVGRFIEHFTTNIEARIHLANEVIRVMKTSEIFEKEVRMVNGDVFILRILPFIRKDNTVDGAVISLFDVSNIKELNMLVSAVYNASPSAILSLRSTTGNNKQLLFEVNTANSNAERLFQLSEKELIGRNLASGFPQLSKSLLHEKAVKVMQTATPWQGQIHWKENDVESWFEASLTPMHQGVVLTLTNVTDKVLADRKFRKNYQELVVTKENYRQLSEQLERKVQQRTHDLAISEERFRMVSSVTSDAICDRNLVNNTIWWSDSFYNWLGFKPSDETATTGFWLSLIHPNDKALVAQTLHQVVNEGAEWRMQYRIRNKAGNYIPVLDQGTALTNEAGIPYRLIGALTDRSAEELKQQNRELEELVQIRTEELKSQKDILEKLFMDLPASLCVIQMPEMVFELTNPSFRRFFGNRPLKGMSVASAAGAATQTLLQLVQQVVATGETCRVAEQMVSLDADSATQVLYFNFVLLPVKEASAIKSIIVFAYDVTNEVLARQKLAETNTELSKLNREFKFVSDFMPQLVWATRPDGFHDFYNRRWYEYTGLSYEQTKGAGWNDVVHPDDRERSAQVWQHSLKTGELYEIEYRFRRHDGQYRWFLGRALPLRDENGTITKWFGTCTDIEDQKRTKELLEQKVQERTAEWQRSNQELEASNYELSQFASIASHDLKEPIRKIIMFSNMIKDQFHGELSENVRSYLERIIISSHRMNLLVKDLLSFTRLSSEKMQFEKTDLNDIVQDVLSDLELVVAEKKALVEVHGLTEAEILPQQMRQVFQNLISNSLKFIADGQLPHIKISGERVSGLAFNAPADPNGSCLKITLEDNGIGFDDQFAGKLFQLFSRLHSKRKYEGTGIGLAIVKKVLERHKGIVTARGKEGAGAEFVFIIPLQQKEHESEYVYHKIFNQN